MENWEAVIIDSTNEKYALEMIIKCRDYLKRYPRVDIESVAEEFSTLSLNTKRDWALKYDMKSIVKTCRIQRRIHTQVAWDRMLETQSKERSAVNGYCDPQDEKYNDKYGW